MNGEEGVKAWNTDPQEPNGPADSDTAIAQEDRAAFCCGGAVRGDFERDWVGPWEGTLVGTICEAHPS